MQPKLYNSRYVAQREADRHFCITRQERLVVYLADLWGNTYYQVVDYPTAHRDFPFSNWVYTTVDSWWYWTSDKRQP